MYADGLSAPSSARVRNKKNLRTLSDTPRMALPGREKAFENLSGLQEKQPLIPDAIVQGRGLPRVGETYCLSLRRKCGGIRIPSYLEN